MKKIYLALMCMASLAIVAACGGGNANKGGEAAESENTEQKAEAGQATADVENPTMAQCFAQFDMDVSKIMIGGGEVKEDGHIKKKAIQCDASYFEKFADGIDREKAEAWKQQVFDYCKSIAKDGKIYQIPEFASDSSNPKEVTSAEDAFKANGRFATGWCFDTTEFRVAVTVKTAADNVHCIAYSLSYMRNSEKKDK